MRAAAVLERLAGLVPIRLCVMAGCDPQIWPDSLGAITESWHDAPCDAGVIQSDDVTVDLDATRQALGRWLSLRPKIVAREAQRLRDAFDLVLGDVPSAAFEAANLVGIQGVAVANFTWDWIYSELGFSAAAAAAAAGYSKATRLLEATPSAPMPAFARRTNVGLIARRASASRSSARRSLGLADRESVVLIAFRAASAPAVRLPARRRGRSYLAPTGWSCGGGREDVCVLPRGTRFEDAVAAADVVLGKPGYGLIGDVEAAGARFLYVPRPGFPENVVLERHLALREGTASIAAQRIARGDWEDELAQLEKRAPPAPAETGGAARAAREIAALLAGNPQTARRVPVDSERTTN